MRKIFYLILLFSVGFLVWLPIFKIFYLQDEWQGLGHIIAEGITHPIAGASFKELIFGENRSLARLLGYFLFGQFPLNSFPLALFSLVFHFINTYLVFVLSQKHVKKIFFSIVAAGAFMLSSVSANAVYWYSASVGTLPATTLILLSIVLFFKYIEKRDTKKLYWIFFVIFISLFFKEIGTFLFLLLPLYDFLFVDRNLPQLLKRYWIFLFFFLTIISFRVGVLKNVSGDKALFLTGQSNNFTETLFVRGLLYPSTSFSLEYFPAPFLLSVARSITVNYYPFISATEFDLVTQTAVLDLVAIILSMVMFLILILSMRTEKESTKKTIYFWFLFIIFSFLPYIIISKNYSYLESRYYYLSMVGAGILMAWFLEKLFSSKRIILKTLSFFIFILYFAGHIKYLQKELTTQALVSDERKSFINQIKSNIPLTSNQRNVFYINSDSDYYIPGNKIPFQQGTGYTLMVILKDKLPISNKFLLDHYLWDIGTQGYKEIDGYGFGYFSDLSLLKETVLRYRIPKESVHSFLYDSKNKRLQETSFDNYNPGKE